MKSTGFFLTLLALWLPFAACASGDEEGATGGGAGVDAGADSGKPDATSGSGGMSGRGGSAGSAGEGATGGTGGSGGQCGNGKLEEGEACDDGNLDAEDGCSPTCSVESAGPGDVCPGEEILLTGSGDEPRTGSASGTTSGQYNHYSSTCGGGSAPDVVYHFTPDRTGDVTVTVTAEFLAIASLRTDCGDAKSELGCGAQTEPGQVLTFKQPVTAGQPVSLILDGFAGTSGDYSVNVVVSPAVCGNGALEVPEICDDGNLVGGDGCSPKCEIEPGGVAGACPGYEFELSGSGDAPRTLGVALDLTGYPKPGTSDNRYDLPGCEAIGGAAAFVGVLSDLTGSLSARMTPSFPRARLAARTECFDESSQLTCTGTNSSEPIELSVPVQAGQWIYLQAGVHWADYDRAGPIELEITVERAACGNGRLDSGEGCDDGNTASGDGCAADCALEPDPVIATCPGAEIALSGSGGSPRTGSISGTTAGATSKFSNCGTGTAPDTVHRFTSDVDGTLTATLKSGFTAALSIHSTCTGSALACAKDPYTESVVTRAVAPGTEYFLHVDGLGTAAGPYTLDLSIKPAVCGDGVRDGSEACDDGNTAANDGCSPTCALEPATVRNTCATAEPVTLVSQGNGVYAATLDSGNTNLSTGHTALQCRPASFGVDAFYSVTPAESGVLRVRLTNIAIKDAVLGMRSTCVGATSGNAADICADAYPGQGDEEIAFVAEAGNTYVIFVDTSSSNALNKGTYTLVFHQSPGTCGDGLRVDPEECDDGNSVAGDGCTATCRIQPLAGLDACPGAPIALIPTASGGRKATISLDTSSVSSQYAGFCGGSGPDAVVQVTPDIAGTLRGSLDASYEALLYARTACNDSSTDLKRDFDSGCDTPSAIEFPVEAGKPIFFFVDGLSGSSGRATLTLVLEP
jgi:cysteine-rich repeat protein